MAKLFDRLLDQFRLWFQKKSEVARFDGIGIADFRENSPHFETTLLASLKLVQHYDTIRYRRIRRHIDWIVNSPLDSGKSALYEPAIRTCLIDFENPGPEEADEPWRTWYSALYASTLVHEATHGLLLARRVPHDTHDFRVRIEKLCFLEENHFLRRVVKQVRERSDSDLAEIVECIEFNFDEATYDASWNASRWQRIRSCWVRHAESQDKTKKLKAQKPPKI